MFLARPAISTAAPIVCIVLSGTPSVVAAPLPTDSISLLCRPNLSKVPPTLSKNRPTGPNIPDEADDELEPKLMLLICSPIDPTGDDEILLVEPAGDGITLPPTSDGDSDGDSDGVTLNDSIT